MQPGGFGPPIRPASESDVASIVAMLVRAFADDPVANFMFAGELRRTRGLRSFFSAQIRHHYLPHGHVYTTDGTTGAAVWGAPDRERHGAQELLQMLPTAPFIVSSRMLGALRLLFDIDGLHPEEPHWYLATLGTEPDRQGHGIGSALIAGMLPRIDEEGIPAYLESSKERNVPLYRRFGFEVIDEHRSEGRAPTIWRMWREPQSPGL